MGRFSKKKSFKQYLPFALVAAMLFGAYQLYDYRAKRAFKRGFTQGVSQMVSNVPYLGARYSKKKVRRAKRSKRYRKSTARRYKKGRKSRRGRKYRHRSKRRRRR